MAGRGRTPKPPDQRRGRAAPQRGEWVDLPPLNKRVLPALPKRTKGEGAWSTRTKRVWRAWAEDPVTATYGPAELAMVVELAYMLEEYVREPRVALAGEIRQWTDRLGLNPKGKRDLRLRLVDEVPADDELARRREAKDRPKVADPTLTG